MLISMGVKEGAVDDRACFGKRWGWWWLTVLVAGD
jgi:hypothetical protein